MSYPIGRVSGVRTATAPDRAGWLPAFAALALIWGSSFLFIKVAVGELHPIYVTTGRVLAGVLTLLVVLAALRVRLPRDRVLWAHMSVVSRTGGVLPFTLVAYGEQRVSSVLAGIWNAVTPLIALPLAVGVFRTERLNARRGVGLLVGFLGVLVVLGVWQGVGGTQLTGQLMCFGAAACYGVAIPYQKRFIAGRPEPGLALATTQLICAAAMLLVIAPVLAGAPPNPGRLSGDVIAAVLALGALGTGIAFVLNMRVIRLAGVSTSTSVTYLMPLVATGVGVLFLDERLSWYQPVGGLVVLCGVAISQGLFSRRRLPTPVPAPTPAPQPG